MQERLLLRGNRENRPRCVYWRKRDDGKTTATCHESQNLPLSKLLLGVQRPYWKMVRREGFSERWGFHRLEFRQITPSSASKNSRVEKSPLFPRKNPSPVLECMKVGRGNFMRAYHERGGEERGGDQFGNANLGCCLLGCTVYGERDGKKEETQAGNKARRRPCESMESP